MGLPGRSPYLIQLTDTHLYADPSAKLYGVAPEPKLEDTVRAVAEIGGTPEFVLVTGDCSSDGTQESYRRLAAKLEVFGAPVYYLPGNHDDPHLLAKVLSKGKLDEGKLAQSFEACGWRFALLDSAIPGEDGGSIGGPQLRWLHETLDAHPSTPTIIALHHAPLPIGSRWLDVMKLADGTDLEHIIARSPQVRLVLFGHVHQVFEERRNNALYASAPSTFFQFMPGSADFAGDDRPPGARIVQLNATECTTYVVRVGANGKPQRES